MIKREFYNLLAPSNPISDSDLDIICNHILDNKLIIKYNYIPETLEDFPNQLIFNDNFKWIIELEDKSNMAMLHLHSLEPIKYLLLAYNQSNDFKLIVKSLDILLSWKNNVSSRENFYSWYAHCVADRTIIIGILLVELQAVKYDRRIIAEIKNLLKDHHEYLLKKENYKPLNHGTMMDRSLLLSSEVLEDKDSHDFAVKRLKMNFSNTFTKNMICIENSVTYSIFNIELFISIEQYLLKPLSKSLHSNFDELINHALEFFDSIKMPDESFPHYGDGEKENLTSIKNSVIYKYYSNHKLFRRYTDEGKINTYKYFDEGFIVLKNNNKYLLCNSGAIKINHKHADDGSIIFYHDNEVFVDSGIYGYDKSELNTYFKSSLAHNSVVLNNQSYNYSKSNINNGYLKNYIENDDYHYFQMVNNHYIYASIIRHMFIIKDTFQILIHDQIISPVHNLITQTFNLSPDIDSVELSSTFKNEVLLNNKIRLTSDSNSEICINDTNKKRGIYSEKFHSKTLIPKLNINKTGINQSITTVISDQQQDSFELDTTFLEFNKIVLSNIRSQTVLDIIPFQESPDYKYFLIIRNLDDKYFWKLYSSLYENEEYAYYIYKDGDRFDIIWYTDKNIIEYEFQEPGKYTLRCFIRNKENHDEKTAFIHNEHIIIYNDDI